jgi:hypothetical protein
MSRDAVNAGDAEVVTGIAVQSCRHAEGIPIGIGALPLDLRLTTPIVEWPEIS